MPQTKETRVSQSSLPPALLPLPSSPLLKLTSQLPDLDPNPSQPLPDLPRNLSCKSLHGSDVDDLEVVSCDDGDLACSRKKILREDSKDGHHGDVGFTLWW